MTILTVVVKLILTMVVSAILTPLIRRLAFTLGAVDKPSKRRVNQKVMPTMGGLAIFVAFFFATFVFLRIQFPTHELFSLFISASVIILTGILDDIVELNPKQKMVGILVAALILYFLGNIKMDQITIPFIGTFALGWASLPITIFWILAITNAVNLIDGLDGLAAGVSMIALFTMGIISFVFLSTSGTYVAIMIFCLFAAILGFLPYNFHPAKIFLGDTGALFIGFMIAYFSLKGLKNVTFITLVIPIIILGVPIVDTLFAMIRRKLNNRPISEADKHHLHHRLMEIGLSHRQTVIIIWAIALVFSFISLLYPISTFWGSVALTIGILIGLELFVEVIGLLGEDRQPLLYTIKKIVKKLLSNKNK